MGQNNSTQSRSSRRQTSAAATSSSRTRNLRSSSTTATTTPGSHLPSPPPSSSSSASPSPPLPPATPFTNNNSNGSSAGSVAPAAGGGGVLAHSSSSPLPPTTTTSSTSGTMASTIPHGYSHSFLHQYPPRANTHHPNHIHSNSPHSHRQNHNSAQQQQQQQHQQQQRPLGTSNTLPANSCPIWHDHHSTVPGPVSATSTTAAVTGASPSSSSATTPSRVLRSTTRRRRLLSAFYPLLSRNSSRRGDTTAPSSPVSAEPSTSHTQSQSHGQNNRLTSNSNPTPNTTPETRPPRHRQPDRPLSRNGLQPTQSTSRSSRGRSRVQRRYDEQSIRSLRSTSSRSSSVLTSPPSAAHATGAAAAASMVPPTSMHSPTYYQHSSTPQTEPMELDHGVHTPIPFPHHYQQHQHYHQYQQHIHLQQPQQQQEQHMSLDPHGAPAHLMPADHATPTRMTVARSRTVDSVFSGRSAGVPTEASLGSRSEASHASNSSRPDPSSHIRFGGLFVGLSNSRGGTSISSSLMPLQPNSEDEDDYGHTAEDDRSQRRASSLYHHLDLGSTATDTEQQQQHQGAGSRASAGESRRPRPPRASRYPPPDLVAELIQGQFEQALAESAATASSTPTIPSGVPLTIPATTPSIPTTESIQQQQHQHQQQQHQHQQQQHQQQHQRATPSDHPATLPRPNSSSTSLETVNNSTAAGESHRDGSTSAGSSTSETPSDSALGEDLFGRRSTRIHRRRLRSSSLRGLLGFQPMSSVMTEERLTGTSTVEGESLPEHRNRSTQGPNGNLDRPRLVETRFFARLIAELGRGLRGHSAQTSESSGDRILNGSTAVATAPTEFATESSLSSNSATNEIAGSTGTESGTTAATALSTAMETTSATDATSSMEGSTTEPSPPVRPRRHTTIRFIQIGEGGRFDLGGGRRSRSRSTGTGLGSLRSDSPEGTTGLAREDLADAIIMLLSNASTTAGLEGESSDNAPDGPEGSRPGRSRRSPWLVLTLSGAFLGSLLAGSGGEGEEGGMSYDDLWALSNLIGPARPTTTTQEAIDNAGFHVGQFDDASKGMRGFHTLGDGSKCLVCMSDYEEGEDMRALSCKHGFHQECIDKWLTTGANKCPVCRAAAVVSSEPVAMAGGPLASEE